MAEMAATSNARYLLAQQELVGKGLAGAHLLRQGVSKGRPSGAGIELGGGREEGRVTGGTAEGAAAVLVVEGGGEGRFSAVLTEDAELGGGKALTPLVFRFRERVGVVEGFGERGDRCNWKHCGRYEE